MSLDISGRREELSPNHRRDDQLLKGGETPWKESTWYRSRTSGGFTLSDLIFSMKWKAKSYANRVEFLRRGISGKKM